MQQPVECRINVLSKLNQGDRKRVEMVIGHDLGVVGWGVHFVVDNCRHRGIFQHQLAKMVDRATVSKSDRLVVSPGLADSAAMRG